MLQVGENCAMLRQQLLGIPTLFIGMMENGHREVHKTVLQLSVKELTRIHGRWALVCDFVPSAKQCYLWRPRPRLLVTRLDLSHSVLFSSIRNMTLMGVLALTNRPSPRFEARGWILNITTLRLKRSSIKDSFIYSDSHLIDFKTLR